MKNQGEKNGRSHLTEIEVREILKHAAADKRMSDTEIACQYNVHPSTIRRIYMKRNWKHIKVEES